ncbi:MAG: NO-inducible flavohemoprotein [Chitinivorax sp.]
MLSAAARPMIVASVPVLREHGETITRCFYQRLFAAHPELHDLFNLGNQASGAQQQALAGAVYAYAANIDNRAALEPVLTRIAHKHASLGITPAQYTIVGKHLLAAIAEVLGSAATPELLAAWDEAYWLLAVELIALEARLYQQAAHAPGNWRALRVVRKQRESELVTSFYLQAADAGALPAFRPGQYVSVALNLESLQRRQIRQYSLSDAPGQGWWRISVKRETAGAATPAGMISNLLHDEVGEGDVLQVSPPFGDFVLDEASDAPVVLLSAGVGVTPLASMLKQLRQCQPTRQVTFAHAARDGRHHALKQELAAECGPAALHTAIFYEQPDSRDRHGVDYHFAGRMQLDRLAPEALCADADYYLCGPLPFMREQRRALLERGIDPQQIRYEVFGPELLGALN